MSDPDKAKVDVEVRYGSVVGELGSFGPRVYLDGRELPSTDYAFDERTGVVMIDPDVMQRAMAAKIAWTRTPPSEDGWYFYRPIDLPESTSIVMRDRGLWYYLGSEEFERDEEMPHLGYEFWPVPIEPPDPKPRHITPTLLGDPRGWRLRCRACGSTTSIEPESSDCPAGRFHGSLHDCGRKDAVLLMEPIE